MVYEISITLYEYFNVVFFLLFIPTDDTFYRIEKNISSYKTMRRTIKFSGIVYEVFGG